MPWMASKKKTLLSVKEISCLQLIFVLIWIKQTLIWFNLQRDTFAESLQLQCQFCTKV